MLYDYRKALDPELEKVRSWAVIRERGRQCRFEDQEERNGGNDLGAIVGILILAGAGSTYGLQGIFAGLIGGVGIYLIVRSAVAAERL